MNQVKTNIDILKKAQDLDREIYLSQQEINEIPELRNRLKRELDFEKNRLAELEADHKKLLLKQKEKEGELSQKEANIRKLDGQLSQVKTNKEYAAMQQEIASFKADISLLEEDIIKFLDQVEAAHEEILKEKERLKQVEKEFQVKESEAAQKEKHLSEKHAAFKKQRDEIVAQVPLEIKTLYDTIVQKKQGLALVRVNGEICGACQLQLRPQLLNEIRLAESLILCENCSRILYFED